MNITASFSSEPSWSRRCSTETIFSIQGKETDFVRDTSDTELGSDAEREYEPATESETEGPLSGHSTGCSDNEIIRTKVIEISVGDDGELQLADSEQTESEGIDSEMDLYDYWLCAQCRAENNNPLYRYCDKCFKVRKNFFPPRPKRKPRRHARQIPSLQMYSQQSAVSAKTLPDTESITDNDEHETDTDEIKPDTHETIPVSDVPLPLSEKTLNNLSKTIQISSIETVSDTKSAIDSQDPERFQRPLSQDSGVESAFNSQESSQEHVVSNRLNILSGRRKRRADSDGHNPKRIRTDYSESDSEKSDAVQPITKMVSDPVLTIDKFKGKDVKDDMCIICFNEPKSGVFVHGRIAHICCCYKCAVKVWSKAKRCPVCNCKVSNVLKAVVM